MYLEIDDKGGEPGTVVSGLPEVVHLLSHGTNS